MIVKYFEKQMQGNFNVSGILNQVMLFEYKFKWGLHSKRPFQTIA